MSDDRSEDQPTGCDDEGPLPTVEAGLPGARGRSAARLHRLLESPRRRRLLSYLVDRPDASLPVDELVDAVVESEWSRRGPSTHWCRVAIDLHHVHLPKLADAGVIEYDPLTETVGYVGPEVLETLLAATEAAERPDEGDRHP